MEAIIIGIFIVIATTCGWAILWMLTVNQRTIPKLVKYCEGRLVRVLQALNVYEESFYDRETRTIFLYEGKKAELIYSDMVRCMEEAFAMPEKEILEVVGIRNPIDLYYYLGR